MRRYAGALAVALLVWPLAAAAQRGPDCPAIPPAPPPPIDAVPAPLDADDWKAANDALSQRLAANTDLNPDIAFIGDSIIESWEIGVFRHVFGSFTTLNMGVRSDLTQSALWRLENGQWGSLRPRVTVLLIGTNNLTRNSQPVDVARGVADLVRFIHARAPSTKILILGLLPRGANPGEAQRAVLGDVNQRIRRCADDATTFYQEPGRALLEPDGTMTYQIAPDLLHPSMVGYTILGMTLEPTIRRLLGRPK